MTFLDYLIIFVFLGMVFALGSWFYKWIGNPDDFMVTGRSITPFILAATLAATNINLYNFVGYAGTSYAHGIGIVWQEWTGMMSLVFSGLFVLPILRRLRVRTVPEYLEMRYSRGVRGLIGVMWVFRLGAWLGVVLYLAVKVAMNVTGSEGPLAFAGWIALFALISIIYTALGGMWAVALTNVLQFVLMLAALLVIVPVAMAKVGWTSGLLAQLSPGSMEFVVRDGPYNWLFIIAIFLLGIQWASTDQGLLQTAFSAKNIRTVNRGLILAGVIMAPIAYLTVIPGLAARILHPGLAQPDDAMGTLLASNLPPIVLGLVLCGLLSSQVSTISANLNATSTLFVNDFYRLVKREVSDKATVFVLRLMIGVSGVIMIVFAYMVPRIGTAVEAYLTVISILDMPLFVMAIFYGLLWKRANWQGAFFGYLAGAGFGIYTQLTQQVPLFGIPVGENMAFAVTAFVSASAALIVTPLVSLLTRPPDPKKITAVWAARGTTAEETDRSSTYHIVPRTVAGKASLTIWGVGLATFFVGVFMGSTGSHYASPVAITGMVIYFAGGLMRAYTE